MSKLRVAGGEARGRRLKAPKNIRPTQGMVKQAIFNMIGPRIEAAGVLDLFAGSGALGFKERAHLVRADVVRWLEASPGAIRSADFVFLDPPYDDVVLDRALKVLDREVEGATVFAEHSRRRPLPELARLRVDRERRYGDTLVTVFQL